MAEGRKSGPKLHRPQALVPNTDSIPTFLKDQNRWVVWKWKFMPGPKGKPGKYKKPPYSPVTGNLADTTDPSTWGTFAQAEMEYAKGHYDGIGLVLVDDRGADGAKTLYCVDIDGCRNEGTGEVDPESLAIVMKMGTWTEVSPSGRGLHLWFLADLPTVGTRKGRYEVYADRRFIAVTGIEQPGGGCCVEERQEEAEYLLADKFNVPHPDPDTSRRIPTSAMTDEEVVKRCSTGVGGLTFFNLHDGNDDHYETTSHADLGYCSRLAFYTQDAYQIEAIWRASKRWREKCDKHPTYVKDTIRKAIETKTAYFDPKFRSGKPGGLNAVPETAPASSSPACPPVTAPATPPPPPTCVSLTSHPAPQNPTPERATRRASDIIPRNPSWFFPPWLPKGELSLVVGLPGTGKSSYSAWLITRAKATVLLPGHEGSAETMLMGRLLAHKVDLHNVHVLDRRHLTMPSNVKSLIAEVRDAGADLVIADPIDTYLDEGISENDAAGVRPALEAFQKVAEETGAAVVGIRHPGRVAGNVCPGSRAWRAVPRRIVELCTDLSSPPRHFLHCFKPGIGAPPADTYFALVHPQGDGAPTFVLGELVRPEEAEVSLMVTDKTQRHQLERACEFIRVVLAEGKQDAGYMLSQGLKLGLSASTLYNAARRMGVRFESEGGGLSAKHFWVPPDKWPG